jgi:hypothetical protein
VAQGSPVVPRLDGNDIGIHSAGSDDRFDQIARRLVTEHEAGLRHLAVEHRLRRRRELALIELDVS